MIHTTHLPTDLQESIWKAYCVGLQERYILKYAPPFLDPIHELLQGSSNLVLDWMAHMLKCSHVKPAKAIVLIGPLGCGKGLFANLLRLLLGQENVSRTTTMQQARLFNPPEQRGLRDTFHPTMTEEDVHEAVARSEAMRQQRMDAMRKAVATTSSLRR